MFVEGFGFFYLFKGIFPAVINFLRRLPVIGAIFLLPGIRTVADRIGQSGSLV
eukprot:m.62719 g.62719  ORF g.62719 m.62719 type:complete len:53 (+) comp16303_c0_seq2:167-325(+)